MAFKDQGRLFPEEPSREGSVCINQRCRIKTQDGYRVVSVSGITLAHYAVGDRMNEAYAMVSLIQQGWAQQREVARAFECSERTVRRYEQRFESGGLAALGRSGGYPQGRPRLPSSRSRRIQRWKAEGISNREIARRLGVDEKAVRKQLRRLGWRERASGQSSLPFEDADPKLSPPPGELPPTTARSVEKPGLDGPSTDRANVEPAEEDTDPNLSDPQAAPPAALSLDRDPADRRTDRLLACVGLLDDASPLFGSAPQVPGAGVLLALPALLESGVLEAAREVYGSLAPAFYGLRTTIVTMLLMALLRVKRPEALKERSPQELGRLLGLDRAPEVKTLRRKLARLACVGRAADFGRELARRRVANRGHAMGFLYVDGHVRVYHGKRPIPKAHVARMRICMPATTDYWVNDEEGDPLFVVTSEANAGLAAMLPKVLGEVRALIGDRRVTVVFDRGGWSPKLFAQLIAEGFDVLTYRKEPWRPVSKRLFNVHEARINGRSLRYVLADQNVRLLKGTLRMRQITRLAEDGHQTPILTSRHDLSAIELAYRMFERWRQENFFKYLRQEYALDALVDYGTEPADPVRDVPNPLRKELDAQLNRARKELAQLQAVYGLEALDNRESLRRTMRGFKIANAPLARSVAKVMKKVADLEKRRARVPARVPIRQLIQGEVVKLDVERKHLSDLLKMVAYQAESDLVSLVSPHYRRAKDEARTLVQMILEARADIEVTADELRVSIEPLSSPHRTGILVTLCEQLTRARTTFPGSRLRMRFDVQSEPPSSLAFPGSRARHTPVEAGSPDRSAGG